MVTLYCKIITNTNSQQKQFDMLHLHQDPKITICPNSSHIVEICIWNHKLFFWPKIQRPSVILSRIPILWDYQTCTRPHVFLHNIIHISYFDLLPFDEFFWRRNIQVVALYKNKVVDKNLNRLFAPTATVKWLHFEVSGFKIYWYICQNVRLSSYKAMGGRLLEDI